MREELINTASEEDVRVDKHREAEVEEKGETRRETESCRCRWMVQTGSVEKMLLIGSTSSWLRTKNKTTNTNNNTNDKRQQALYKYQTNTTWKE